MFAVFKNFQKVKIYVSGRKEINLIIISRAVVPYFRNRPRLAT